MMKLKTHKIEKKCSRLHRYMKNKCNSLITSVLEILSQLRYFFKKRKEPPSLTAPPDKKEKIKDIYK